MSEVKFPYQGWVLTPSFKPVEKTFFAPYNKEWHRSTDGGARGTYHQVEKIFPSMEAAIAWGRSDLDKQEAALDKKHFNIQKRRAALDKASA
ncbi:hypothetical protein [Delftia acidovorans]|uniref:Uncharacterized protein n=1 Tax=Delftia acidovorans TaxID=80866 RepID=A0AAJ2R8V6_DELAC|nr:hypothetical protein [Delftia acidovorans]MDX4957262.1 hypothetical protein [Delftia acidovorans]